MSIFPSCIPLRKLEWLLARGPGKFHAGEILPPISSHAVRNILLPRQGLKMSLSLRNTAELLFLEFSAFVNSAPALGCPTLQRTHVDRYEIALKDQCLVLLKAILE